MTTATRLAHRWNSTLIGRARQLQALVRRPTSEYKKVTRHPHSDPRSRTTKQTFLPLGKSKARPTGAVVSPPTSMTRGGKNATNLHAARQAAIRGTPKRVG